MPFSNWSRFVSVLSLLIALASGSGYSWQQQQDAIARIRAQEERQFKTAENKWMKVPVDVRTQPDPVPLEHRQARDNYWDNLIEATKPLSDSNAQGRPLPTADAVVSGPEMPNLNDGVLVIGKFESYRTILSASQRSIYTEIQLSVQHVFGRPDAPIHEGELIDLIRPGGTIIAPWGSTLSYEVHPEQMGLQPQHTYLIRLGYDPAGNFYGGGYRTGQLWDLSDGTVKPGNSLQKARAEHGMSEINGLTLDALVQLLDKKYEEHYQHTR